MKQPSVAASCIIHFWRIEHFCGAFRSDAAATSTSTRPGLNLRKISPVFAARLTRRAFKVVFFIEKLQMRRAAGKQFHLSPNEAFADPVSKLQSNKLQPANINEICSPTAKPVRNTGFHRREPPNTPSGELISGFPPFVLVQAGGR